uniref:Uncharacterized protein n=1 Tax=Rhizophora mucronata TaxID=61149 RepID=A0A2P2INF5_RHIMU
MALVFILYFKHSLLNQFINVFLCCYPPIIVQLFLAPALQLPAAYSISPWVFSNPQGRRSNIASRIEDNKVG